MSTNKRYDGGLIVTDCPSQSAKVIQSSFRNFLYQPRAYQKNYLQKNFTQAFDGYSYLGQKDSSNQYETDLLHSFVISGLSPIHKYPTEFQSFLINDWKILTQLVRALEKEVIETLDIPGLSVFHDRHMDHMVSCNYYPALDQLKNRAGLDLRLSRHKDVSLFSVFIFGIDDGLSYEIESGEQKRLGQRSRVVIFPGYFLELISGGKYKAVEHQVELPKDNVERYSFAFFSIPKPESKIDFAGLELTGESYYEQYLNLF
ncbi:2OG-Fe(II) oxygenase family protein [Reichenbachiella sp.]|uniref:2OG-Fe(II) oxygenase family protein n=1 Tax=Reichenbachiella sp. TaxID=2184521 RepID=UPI003B5CD9C5